MGLVAHYLGSAPDGRGASPLPLPGSSWCRRCLHVNRSLRGQGAVGTASPCLSDRRGPRLEALMEAGRAGGQGAMRRYWMSAQPSFMASLDSTPA